MPGQALSAPGILWAIGWHSHEMLFGYAVAIIAGFLLTAVRNWTGVTPPTGTPLGLLFLLWLAGRVAPFLSGVIPPALIAIIDLAFLLQLHLPSCRPSGRESKRSIGFSCRYCW